MLLLDGATSQNQNYGNFVTKPTYSDGSLAKVGAFNIFHVTITGDDIETYERSGVEVYEGRTLDFVVTRLGIDESQQLLAQANSALADLIKTEDDLSLSDAMDKMENIADLYKSAADADDTNSQASFGAALFGFQLFFNNSDWLMIRDTLETWNEDLENLDQVEYWVTQYFMNDINDVWIQEDQWGWYWGIDPGSAFGALMYLVQNSFSNPNVIELIQSTIDTTLIAKLDESIMYMDRVLADENFIFMLSPDISEEDEAFEMDLGEAYLISAIMHMARGSLKIMNSYQLSLPGANSITDYTDITNSLPIVRDEDINDGDFLTLRDLSILPSAKQDYIDALTMVQDGVNYIQTEIDSQSNDLITKQDVTDGDTEIDEEFSGVEDRIPFPALRNTGGIVDLAGRIQDMLDGPFDVEINEDDEPVDIISVDLSAFLNNGMADLKDFLPLHEWNDLDTVKKEFYGWGIDSWGDYYFEEQELSAIETPLLNIYQRSKTENVLFDNSEVCLYWNYYGTISGDGVVTIAGIYGYWNGEFFGSSGWFWYFAPLSADDNITTDGAFYLDSEKRLCITQEAYDLLNASAANAPRGSVTALEQMEIAAEMNAVNYTPEHPYGVRDVDGVFKFAGTPDYDFDDDDPIYFVDGDGVEIDIDKTMPIFPDYTFGGIFPGMTKERFDDIVNPPLVDPPDEFTTIHDAVFDEFDNIVLTFNIPEDSYIEAYIVGDDGYDVRTVIEEYKAAGTHSIAWDKTDDDDVDVVPGIYGFYIESDDFSSIYWFSFE